MEKLQDKNFDLKNMVGTKTKHDRFRVTKAKKKTRVKIHPPPPVPAGPPIGEGLRR